MSICHKVQEGKRCLLSILNSRLAEPDFFLGNSECSDVRKVPVISNGNKAGGVSDVSWTYRTIRGIKLCACVCETNIVGVHHSANI